MLNLYRHGRFNGFHGTRHQQASLQRCPFEERVTRRKVEAL